MALDATNFASVGYANGQNVYLYRTTDTSAVVEGANYFNPATLPALQIYDLITVISSTGGTAEIDVYFVSALTSTLSTVTRGT